MNFDILNELIEMPKKVDASKSKKKLYVEQMVNLLSEDGFSSNAIKYLKGGFSFAGAKPIAIYFQKMTEQQRGAEIAKLLASELFRGGDKLTAFRFGISLSAYSLAWFGEDQQIFINLIKVLPIVSKNKEKQLLKDAPKIFEKYFLDVVSDSTQLPPLDISALKGIYIAEYRKMLEEILNKVSATYKDQALRLEAWIGGIKISNDSFTPGQLAATGIEEKEIHNVVSRKSNSVATSIESGNKAGDVITVTSSVDSAQNVSDCPIDSNPKEAVAPFSKKELLDAVTLFESFSERLRETISKWTSTQNELEMAKQKIAELTRELQQSNTQLDSEKKHSAQLSEELTCRSKMIMDLRAQILEAKEVITSLEQQIKEASEENGRLSSIISVYSSDKQSSQTEQLNAIASKLKSEYRDFKDVENEEMSIDLGENFRFQLQSVFKILTKAGIDVERK